MLQILKKNRQKPQKQDWERNNHDITIVKKSYEEKIDKDGTYTKKPVFEKINLTRKINATAEAVKAKTAEEKLNELKKIL